MNISDNTFLITGGAGFIGSHLADRLLREGAKKVIIIDNLSTGNYENIRHLENEPRFAFYQEDISNLDRISRIMQETDVVFHEAALGSVPRSIEAPLNTHQANATGFLTVLWAAKEAGIKRFVFASSSSVYGDDETLPKQEEKTGTPLSPYAVSKKINELYADVFYKLHTFPVIGLRYFNVFGPRQDPKGAYAAVIPKFIYALLKDEIPTIYGDGEQSRDFTYVANVVEGNIRALLAPEEALGQIYNIALGGSISVNKIFTEIAKALGKEGISPKYAPPRKGDIKHSRADISKARKTLGFEPVVSFEEGMQKTVAWYRKKFGK